MIVPSIDLMGGQAVQLVGGKEHALDAGDPRPLLERFGRVGEVAVIDLDAALSQGDNVALIEDLCRRGRVRVGGGIRDLVTARRWLDAGAEKIIIGTAARRELLAELPRERLIVALDAVEGEVVVEGWRTKTGASIADRMRELSDLVSGFLVTFVEREGRMEGTDLPRVKDLVEAAGGARVTIAGGVTTAEEIAALDALGADAQVGMALYTGRLGLAEAFAAPLASDRPDGLFTTVVVDEHGRALGQCFSNLESLGAALESGTGTYWSRRRGLWQKGATSGHTQRLLRIDVDCDRDALRFVVRPAGPFCHVGSESCWGDLEGLPRLAATLRARAEDAPAGSYTRRLIDDPALLRAKLVEEAGELADARAPAEVAHEAADVIYFALVAAARAGVTLPAIEAELDRRARRVSRRPGDAKVALAGGSGQQALPEVEEAGDVAAASDLGEGDLRPPESAHRAEAAADRALTIRLRRVAPADVRAQAREAFDAQTLAEARAIVDDVASGGDVALRRYAARFGELEGPLVIEGAALAASLDAVEPSVRALLERTADRVRRFAEAQRAAIAPVDVAIDGGRAGHRVLPVARAGCYAPGGRYPLPSSVLMTAVTARVAGVSSVWVASPKPTAVTRAAAAIAGADALLCAGGAHAIAAFGYGTETVPAVDVIAGPGNRWVTAAKQLVSVRCGIDMLAGPSELVVLAAEADPELVAADLLAQAEHDPDALPIVVAFDEALVVAIERALAAQLVGLPTAEIARQALDQGFAVICDDDETAVEICDRLAPEHLLLCGPRAEALADRFGGYGALFVGERSGEVLGDYGAGPNHVLPTGGTARHTAGLSVLSFLRARTWLALDDPRAVARDAADLARLEGLEAHARAADRRR